MPLVQSAAGDRAQAVVSVAAMGGSGEAMTADQITQLTQTTPVPNLSARLGEIVADTRKAVAHLEDKLRELDQVTADLAGHNLHVVTDLGPTGNAARNARTATLADQDTAGFSLPKAS